MVVHPDVKGTVSLNLKEATVPEALEAIRQVYGYEYRRDGGRFLVLGAEMQTRIFTVNYLNVIRRSTSAVSATKGGSIGGGTTGTTGDNRNDNRHHRHHRWNVRDIHDKRWHRISVRFLERPDHDPGPPLSARPRAGKSW